MEQFDVLIISDEPAFSRAVTARWQGELRVPAFTTVGSDLQAGFAAESFDLAIVGGIDPGALAGVLHVLSSCGKPVAVVADDNATADLVKGAALRAVLVRRDEGWSDVLNAIATQMLLRQDAIRQQEKAENTRILLEREAALGRYMVDIRHTVNNALTAILGNSELLLFEPGKLPSSAVAQVETIRDHSLRIHEIMQRFSSLEKEMTFAERQALKGVSQQRMATACD